MLQRLSDLSGKVVLVVENEWLIAEDLRLALVRLGVRVIGPAGSLDEAFALIADEGHVDAALLDVHLGDEGDVYPLAERLRSRGTAIVFATGYDDFAVRHDFVGMPHLLKPFMPDAIAPVLAASTSMRRTAAVAAARA